VDVSPLFIPDAQAAELAQAGEGSFDHPSTSAQPTAVFGISLCEPIPDPANS
jgi:hypothetical protein